MIYFSSIQNWLSKQFTHITDKQVSLLSYSWIEHKYQWTCVGITLRKPVVQHLPVHQSIFLLCWIWCLPRTTPTPPTPPPHRLPAQWKSSGYISHLLTNTVLLATVSASRFSLFLGFDSEPCSDFCCLGSETWYALRWWDSYSFGLHNSSSSKLSLAAAFGRYSGSTLLYQNREISFSPILYLLCTNYVT